MAIKNYTKSEINPLKGMRKEKIDPVLPIHKLIILKGLKKMGESMTTHSIAVCID